MADVVAGIDLGTSSVKVALLGPDGRVLATGTAPYLLNTPAPGIAEQNPADWWHGVGAALAQARAACGPHQIVGLCLAGQMHGIVLLGADDRPVRPAIIWADQRGAAQCDAIEQAITPERLVAITGSRAAVGLSAPKLLWVRDNEPDVWAQVRRVLLPKDYVRRVLVGDDATEPSDASATLLYDLERADWSGELLERLALDARLLPPVVPSAAAFALGRSAAQALDLPAGLPVVAGAGDTPAQALGYGITRPDQMLLTISSGGQLLAPLPAPRTDLAGRIHTFAHCVPGRWYALGALQAAGLALQWLRDATGGAPLETLLAEAANVPAGARGLVFLPYLLGERTPHRDALARGALVGLTMQHGRPELVRAVLEGVAFAFCDADAVLRELGSAPTLTLLGSGGSRSALWGQILADVLGRDLFPAELAEGAARGAALLAGQHLGWWPAEHAPDLVMGQAIVPDAARHQFYRERWALYRECYPLLRDMHHRLHRATPPA